MELYKKYFKEEFEVNNLKINIQRQEMALKAMLDKKSPYYKERLAYIKQLKDKLKDVESDMKARNKRNPKSPLTV